MGIRFRKNIKVAPGVKVNLNKNSSSVTLGGKGAHYTISSNGKKTTSVNLPGGLSYVETSGTSSDTSPRHDKTPSVNESPFYQSTWFIILMLFCCCFPIGLFLMWKYKKFPKAVRIIISVFFGLMFVISIVRGPSESSLSDNATAQLYDEVSTAAESIEETATAADITTIAETTTISETTAIEETTVASETSTVEEIMAPETIKETTEATCTYILNKSTKKFHYPSCSSVDKIKPSNYGEFEGTRDDVISKGYSPCGRCNP